MLTQQQDVPSWLTADTDAIPHTVDALNDLEDALNGIEFLHTTGTPDDPKHRDVLRTTLEAALAALRNVEDYDDATITAAISTMRLGEVA